jgi:hypothetical protein
MKIYIAGKISGLEKQQYTSKFRAAEIQLTAAGHITINPCRLGICDSATTDEALPVCLNELRHCEAIYMLPDWSDSPGAIRERQFAIDHNIRIIYHNLTSIIY